MSVNHGSVQEPANLRAFDASAPPVCIEGESRPRLRQVFPVEGFATTHGILRKRGEASRVGKPRPLRIKTSLCRSDRHLDLPWLRGLGRGETDLENAVSQLRLYARPFHRVGQSERAAILPVA